MAKNSKFKWITFGILAAISWGISGLFGKILFQSTSMSAMMLTQIRMVIGGIVILGISIILKHDIFAMFKDWRMVINLVLYAILGMIPDQLFYFMTVDYGDASIATILQYLGPFFIMLYMALFHHQIPSRLEIISAIVAFFGVMIIATDGKFTSMEITPKVLFWGILSAIGVMLNTILPRPLLKKYNALDVTGWGLIVAGISLIAGYPEIQEIQFNFVNIFNILVVSILGTALAFLFYMLSLEHISPTIVSLLDAFEPITATLGSVLFLGLTLHLPDIWGMLLILIAVIGLNYQPQSKME